MAGSKLVKAQAIWDDPDDLTKSKKTGCKKLQSFQNQSDRTSDIAPSAIVYKRMRLLWHCPTLRVRSPFHSKRL
ncbi:hypothetical protein [Nostoc commune]|uniref:hypothetical protein n=1 Tax=Nostoc commune TaxID=1178 RepID=UPI0011B27E8A|nr:hypothetical protein [Nostoc commune]